MSRRPALVTQADINRALRAMQQANYSGALEIAPDGTIRIVPARVMEGATSSHTDRPDLGAPLDQPEILDL